MAVSSAMFIFEVVIQEVQSLVQSRVLILRGDFSDIFSLELKDPKQMTITMPEPPPLPPEPPGKKGKKKKPPKPKGKKGKKGAVELPPPEPVIQSGQSVLFTSTAEFLIQEMNKYPLEISLWSKEDMYVYIGCNKIPWDPAFLTYLSRIANGEFLDSTTVNDTYNVFEESNGKMMAKIGVQVKLSYLGEKVTTAFRTLSEDPSNKKYLYTGINSKVTSYMCTMKTTDEDFEENCNKIDNNYTVDTPKPQPKIVYADFKNAPGVNVNEFTENNYCCKGHADKPPYSKYKVPEKFPDIDFIIEYVRKIMINCNDQMRALTPRPTIRPIARATDIDKKCYCRETAWPEGILAERFKEEVLSSPCPVCRLAADQAKAAQGTTFDVANIRGPCGKADCLVARRLRKYIEQLIAEDNVEVDINDLIGPCGSQSCTVAKKIQQVILKEGAFKEGATLEGLSTQCACIQTMQKALSKKKTECDSECSDECDEIPSDDSKCGGPKCPYNTEYQVYYCTVEITDTSGATSPPCTTNSSTYKYCSTECPNVKPSDCSKNVCLTSHDGASTSAKETTSARETTPGKSTGLSPADSDIVLDFDAITNQCCVESCKVVDELKDLIVEGQQNRKKRDPDGCYCVCDCSFKPIATTTYCPVCTGYVHLGEDLNDMPEYLKPHACPVYSKTYRKEESPETNPWATYGKQVAKEVQAVSNKKPSGDRRSVSGFSRSLSKVKEKKEKKKVGKFTANVDKTLEEKQAPTKPKLENKYRYPPVPKHMGWNWTAEDIPGLKPRPKWKPGACNKILVRRYRAIRFGQAIMAKKKRAAQQKKKKELRSTLIVTKKNGEYTVQMEVFKKYSKERLIFQNPYDDKPPLVYTIGKTEEEKARLKKRRERLERKEYLRKSRILQASFRNRCSEICGESYKQAMGIIPLPDPDSLVCPCHTEPAEKFIETGLESCTCSDDPDLSSSDTDDDEWVIEFNPPAARYDPKARYSIQTGDAETQYTYLDYKVRLLDKHGIQVPRFFKGPDGSQECSDLGGFWGPGHVWLEINKDGYIGPDVRWVPMNFIGPDGMLYSAEEGGFTDNTGKHLRIGIDGYIDKDGKWAWYSRRPRPQSKTGKSTVSPLKKSVANQAASPSRDKPADKANVKINTTPTKSSIPAKKPHASTNKNKSALVMTVSTNYMRSFQRSSQHPRNPDRIRQDAKRIAKYKEIMDDLQMYDDFHEIKPMTKTNRASNTPYKNVLPSRFPFHNKTFAGVLAPVLSFDTNRTTSETSPGSHDSPMICE